MNNNDILANIIGDITEPLQDLELRAGRINNPHYRYASRGKEEDAQQLLEDLQTYMEELEEQEDQFYKDNQFNRINLYAGLAVYQTLKKEVQEIQERVSFESRGRRI